MKIAIYIILMLLIIPFAFAEEKLVQTYVKIESGFDNVTIYAPNQLEPKSYQVTGIGTNSTTVYNYSFVVKTNLECTETKLENLTSALIDTCKDVQAYTTTCGEIFSTNTQLSSDIVALKTQVENKDNLEQQLASCNQQLSQQPVNSNTSTQDKMIWAGLGAIGCYIGVMIMRNRRQRNPSMDVRGPTR